MPSGDHAPEPSADLTAIATLIRAYATQATNNAPQLLALLRCLEALHQEIREQAFQAALPTNRQALYALLREIEASGGWPFIPRMQLQDFMQRMEITTLGDESLIDSLEDVEKP